MYEAAPYIETFDRGTACQPDITGKLLHDIKERIVLVVHDIHDGDRCHISCFEDRISVGIDDGIVGIYLRDYELLHYIGNFRFFVRKNSSSCP